MITFAAIAAAGDVNVNAIAPGIAAALLATMTGLFVAIPALFGYNYLLIHNKNGTANMQVFVDEFVTRLAEVHRNSPTTLCLPIDATARNTHSNYGGRNAMQVQDDDRPYDDINITPMLDLAYVLLIIFIIMTTASVQGIKVDLCSARSVHSR